ncbi:hypothetical protein AB7813_04530 [Tardiphaga sp. 20_F10_N6_6]|jgi:hypothetical protein|uniref:hypothetical protein n=1 Tax=unclassified Tardiphaga TaxID=2631404 RepID=UPI0011C466EB
MVAKVIFIVSVLPTAVERFSYCSTPASANPLAPKYELSIDVNSAKQLGLSVPPALRAEAPKSWKNQ